MAMPVDSRCEDIFELLFEIVDEIVDEIECTPRGSCTLLILSASWKGS